MTSEVPPQSYEMAQVLTRVPPQSHPGSGSVPIRLLFDSTAPPRPRDARAYLRSPGRLT